MHGIWCQSAFSCACYKVRLLYGIMVHSAARLLIAQCVCTADCVACVRCLLMCWVGGLGLQAGAAPPTLAAASAAGCQQAFEQCGDAHLVALLRLHGTRTACMHDWLRMHARPGAYSCMTGCVCRAFYSLRDACDPPFGHEPVCYPSLSYFYMMDGTRCASAFGHMHAVPTQQQPTLNGLATLNQELDALCSVATTKVRGRSITACMCCMHAAVRSHRRGAPRLRE
jgi:hypothetical protein